MGAKPTWRGAAEGMVDGSLLLRLRMGFGTGGEGM